MNTAQNILKDLVGELKSIAKTETIVGAPVSAGEYTIIPISRVALGVGAGGGGGDAIAGGEGGAGGDAVRGEGGGGGGGAPGARHTRRCSMTHGARPKAARCRRSGSQGNCRTWRRGWSISGRGGIVLPEARLHHSAGELRFARFWPHRHGASALRKALQSHNALPKRLATRVAPHEM